MFELVKNWISTLIALLGVLVIVLNRTKAFNVIYRTIAAMLSFSLDFTTPQ